MTSRDLPAVEPASKTTARAAPAVRVALPGHSPYSAPQSEPLDVRAASLPGGDWLVEVRTGPRKVRALRLALWKLGGALGLLARAPGHGLQRARELPAQRRAVTPPEPMPAALIEQAAPVVVRPEVPAQVPPPEDAPAATRAPRKLLAALASLLVAAVGALLTKGAPAPAQRDAGIAVPAAADAPEALTYAARAEGAAVTIALVLAAPMPDKPFRRQARPPCLRERYEVEKNGGCWIPVDRQVAQPPCPGAYEKDGACYVPVAMAEREPRAVLPAPDAGR